MKLANYYSRIRAISRNNGGSIAAAIAYILREILVDCRTGRSHDHRFEPAAKNKSTANSDTVNQPSKRKKRTDLHTHFIASWIKIDLSIQALVDIFEKAEKHPKANLGRDLIIAIPRELANERQLMVEIVRLFATALSRTLRTAVIVAIHLDDNGNPHAHIFIPNRELGIDPKTGQPKAAQRRSKLFRNLTNPKTSWGVIREIRATWAHLQNRCLKRMGIDKRVYSGSYRRIGYPYLPTYHVGNKGGEIAKAAVHDNELIKKRNQIVRDSTLFADLRILRNYKKSLIRKLMELEKQAEREKREDETSRSTIKPANETTSPRVETTEGEVRPIEEPHDITQTSIPHGKALRKALDNSTNHDDQRGQTTPATPVVNDQSFSPSIPNPAAEAKHQEGIEKQPDNPATSDLPIDAATHSKSQLSDGHPETTQEAQIKKPNSELKLSPAPTPENLSSKPGDRSRSSSQVLAARRTPHQSPSNSFPVDPTANPLSRNQPTTEPETNSNQTSKSEDEQKAPQIHPSTFPLVTRESTNRTPRKKKDGGKKHPPSEHKELNKQSLDDHPIEKGLENVEKGDPTKPSIKTLDTLGAETTGKSKSKAIGKGSSLPGTKDSTRQNKALERKSDKSKPPARSKRTHPIISHYFSIPIIDGAQDPNFNFKKAYNKLLRSTPRGGLMPSKYLNEKEARRIRELVNPQKPRGMDRC